jgi:hypothetical protein
MILRRVINIRTKKPLDVTVTRFVGFANLLGRLFLSQLGEKATIRLPASSVLQRRMLIMFRAFTATTSIKTARSWRKTWKTGRTRSPEAQFFGVHQCHTLCESTGASACTLVICQAIQPHTAVFASQRKWRPDFFRIRLSEHL